MYLVSISKKKYINVMRLLSIRFLAHKKLIKLHGKFVPTVILFQLFWEIIGMLAISYASYIKDFIRHYFTSLLKEIWEKSCLLHM